MIDWRRGQYERTAREVEPVAAHAVAVAGLHGGDRVVDLATGTGNAALIAARTGAAVTGLDAAERLIAVARERAAEADADIDFRVGDLSPCACSHAAIARAFAFTGEIVIEADSPEAYLAANDEHPANVAAKPILERAGTAETVRELALAALREGNEDRSGFKATTHYRLIEVRPSRTRA